MNGVVETMTSLRNVQYMGVSIKQVWLVEPCSMADDHVLFVSRNQDGHWRLSLVGKKPTPAVIRKMVTAGEDEAIRIAGLITTADDPAGFYDIVERSRNQDGSSLVEAELCERVHRGMRTETRAA